MAVVTYLSVRVTLTEGVGNSPIYGLSTDVWSIHGYSDRGDPEYMQN